MSESDSGSQKVETRGKCLRRHKLELKELSDKFSSEVKLLNDKKDQKSRKKVFELDEKNMKDRHMCELKLIAQLAIDSKGSSLEIPETKIIQNETNEPTFAEKRRKKKMEKIRQEQEMLEAESANHLSPSAIETEAILSKLKLNKLQIRIISGDGHCLFRAILHQLICKPEKSSKILQYLPSDLSSEESVFALRGLAVLTMSNNIDDYAPFLIGDGIEDFENYFKCMRTTATWGGECEIKAISHALSLQIKIWSANDNLVEFGTGGDVINLVLRKQLSLGGMHYDSAVHFDEESEETVY